MGGETEVLEEAGAGSGSGTSRFQVGIAQTIGAREHQEDSYCVSNWKDAEVISRQGLLAAVADGIGGLDDGQVASTALMQSFRQGFGELSLSMSVPDKLLSLVADGQRDVLELNRRGHRCGTTLVCTLIQDGSLYLISAGDSRICLYRGGALLQLNREHVLGKEKDELKAFLDQKDDVGFGKRAAITSYIGKEGFRVVDRTLTPMRLVP
ncbi:MAG: protein phosphatase 2C domain-containing protein, partial [Blautia sp.]|nr:protein phosphatase 2C domain-containing protein [Blautia sp.]